MKIIFNAKKNYKINSDNKVLYIAKRLIKNNTFWWNLLPAIAITAIFFLLKRDAVSYIVGCIGILNWGAVIRIIKSYTNNA
jgi:hypothetical protein